MTWPQAQGCLRLEEAGGLSPSTFGGWGPADTVTVGLSAPRTERVSVCCVNPSSLCSFVSIAPGQAQGGPGPGRQPQLLGGDFAALGTRRVPALPSGCEGDVDTWDCAGMG